MAEWKYDNLPTAATNDDVITIANSAMAQRIEWFNGKYETGWAPFFENQNIKIEQLQLVGSDIHVVRCTATLKNVDINNIVKYFYNAELAEKKVVDPDIKYHKVVKQIDENIHISHSQYDTPFPISNREFVAIRNVQQVDNMFVISIQSINYNDVPFTKGFVRGSSNCGTLLMPIEGSTDVKIITVDHIDPKGWIPTAVINKYKMKTATRIERIQNAYQKK